MAALFGNSASAPNQSKNLVEFRAGKMHMKGKMVHPDKRKGMVYVYQSDDSLMHFCWKDRTSGTVEDDLIIFPDDIEFKHVAQCTTGRVYVLKFKSSSRKFFFWLQEPKTEKDEDNCKKVNDFLNNPPTPGSSRGGAGAGGLASDISNLGDQDLQNILGGMSQQQLMQLLGGMGMGGGAQSPGGVMSHLIGRPSSAQSTVSEPPLRTQSSAGTRATSAETTPSQPRPVTAAALPSQTTGGDAAASSAASAAAAPGAPGSSAQIQLSDLQNILSTMNVPADGAAKEGVDLAKALSPESMIPILANPGVQERLIPFLPEGNTLPKTEQELRDTVKSPQFQQALSSFSSALQSGQLGPLMAQFGLGDDVANAAAQGDMEAFVKAMQEATKKKEGDKEDSMEHWLVSGPVYSQSHGCLEPGQPISKQCLVGRIFEVLKDESCSTSCVHFFSEFVANYLVGMSAGEGIIETLVSSEKERGAQQFTSIEEFVDVLTSFSKGAGMGLDLESDICISDCDFVCHPEVFELEDSSFCLQRRSESQDKGCRFNKCDKEVATLSKKQVHVNLSVGCGGDTIDRGPNPNSKRKKRKRKGAAFSKSAFENASGNSSGADGGGTESTGLSRKKSRDLGIAIAHRKSRDFTTGITGKDDSAAGRTKRIHEGEGLNGESSDLKSQDVTGVGGMRARKSQELAGSGGAGRKRSHELGGAASGLGRRQSEELARVGSGLAPDKKSSFRSGGASNEGVGAVIGKRSTGSMGNKASKQVVSNKTSRDSVVSRASSLSVSSKMSRESVSSKASAQSLGSKRSRGATSSKVSKELVGKKATRELTRNKESKEVGNSERKDKQKISNRAELPDHEPTPSTADCSLGIELEDGERVLSNSGEDKVQESSLDQAVAESHQSPLLEGEVGETSTAQSDVLQDEPANITAGNRIHEDDVNVDNCEACNSSTVLSSVHTNPQDISKEGSAGTEAIVCTIGDNEDGGSESPTVIDSSGCTGMLGSSGLGQEARLSSHEEMDASSPVYSGVTPLEDFLQTKEGSACAIDEGLGADSVVELEVEQETKSPSTDLECQVEEGNTHADPSDTADDASAQVESPLSVINGEEPVEREDQKEEVVTSQAMHTNCCQDDSLQPKKSSSLTPGLTMETAEPNSVDMVVLEADNEEINGSVDIEGPEEINESVDSVGQEKINGSVDIAGPEEINELVVIAAQEKINGLVDNVAQDEINGSVDIIGQEEINGSMYTVVQEEINVLVDTVAQEEINGSVDTVVQEEIKGSVDTVEQEEINESVDTVEQEEINGSVDTVGSEGINGSVDIAGQEANKVEMNRSVDIVGLEQTNHHAVPATNMVSSVDGFGLETVEISAADIEETCDIDKAKFDAPIPPILGPNESPKELEVVVEPGFKLPVSEENIDSDVTAFTKQDSCDIKEYVPQDENSHVGNDAHPLEKFNQTVKPAVEASFIVSKNDDQTVLPEQNVREEEGKLNEHIETLEGNEATTNHLTVDNMSLANSPALTSQSDHGVCNEQGEEKRMEYDVKPNGERASELVQENGVELDVAATYDGIGKNMIVSALGGYVERAASEDNIQNTHVKQVVDGCKELVCQKEDDQCTANCVEAVEQSEELDCSLGQGEDSVLEELNQHLRQAAVEGVLDSETPQAVVAKYKERGVEFEGSDVSPGLSSGARHLVETVYKRHVEPQDSSDSFASDSVDGDQRLNEGCILRCLTKWRRTVFRRKWPVGDDFSTSKGHHSSVAPLIVVDKSNGNQSDNVTADYESSDGRLRRQMMYTTCCGMLPNLSSDVDTGQAHKAACISDVGSIVDKELLRAKDTYLKVDSLCPTNAYATELSPCRSETHSADDGSLNVSSKMDGKFELKDNCEVVGEDPYKCIAVCEGGGAVNNLSMTPLCRQLEENGISAKLAMSREEIDAVLAGSPLMTNREVLSAAASKLSTFHDSSVSFVTPDTGYEDKESGVLCSKRQISSYNKTVDDTSAEQEEIVCHIMSDKPLDQRVSITYLNAAPDNAESGIATSPEIQLRVRLAGNLPALSSALEEPSTSRRSTPHFETHGFAAVAKSPCVMDEEMEEFDWRNDDALTAISQRERAAHEAVSQQLEAILSLVDIVFWIFLGLGILLYEIA